MGRKNKTTRSIRQPRLLPRRNLPDLGAAMGRNAIRLEERSHHRSLHPLRCPHLRFHSYPSLEEGSCNGSSTSGEEPKHCSSYVVRLFPRYLSDGRALLPSDLVSSHQRRQCYQIRYHDTPNHPLDCCRFYGIRDPGLEAGVLHSVLHTQLNPHEHWNRAFDDTHTDHRAREMDRLPNNFRTRTRFWYATATERRANCPRKIRHRNWISCHYVPAIPRPAIFLPVAQNIFLAKLVSNMSNLPNVDPQAVLNGGATELRQLVTGVDLETLLSDYNGAIVDVFYMVIAMAAITIFGAVLVEWRNLRATAAKQAGGPPVPGKVENIKESV